MSGMPGRQKGGSVPLMVAPIAGAMLALILLAQGRMVAALLCAACGLITGGLIAQSRIDGG